MFAVISWADVSGNGSLLDEAAMLGAIGGFITSMVVLWRQRRTHDKLNTIEGTLNHTDQEVASDGAATLGQRMVQLQRVVTEGFARNDQFARMATDAMHQQGQRVDELRTDVKAVVKRADRFDSELSATKTAVLELQIELRDHNKWERSKYPDAVVTGPNPQGDKP